MSAEAILVLLGAVGGGTISAIIMAVANRGKTGAETTKTLVDTATNLLGNAVEATERAEQRMADAEKLNNQLLTEVRQLELKVDNLQVTVASLSQQLTDHGIQPVWPAGISPLG